MAAYTHEINLPRLTAQLALKNKLLLGCGWGADYDTTYAGTFNLSPYYNVPAYTLQQFNHNRAYTLADAHNLKFSDQLNLSYKKIFELEAYVVYEHQNSGRPNVPVADPTLGTSAVPAPGYYAAGSAANGTPVYAHAVQAKGTQDWFDVGVRPAVNLTPSFALVSELTYNYVDNRAYDADRRAANQYLGTRFKTGPGHLVKFTLCPTLQYGTVGNYPVLLRFYYTVAWWNDALKGSTVGGDAYLRRNVGQIVGTQAEVNF